MYNKNSFVGFEKSSRHVAFWDDARYVVCVYYECYVDTVDYENAGRVSIGAAAMWAILKSRDDG